MPTSSTKSPKQSSTRSSAEPKWETLVSDKDFKKLERLVQSQAQLIRSQKQALDETNRRIADLRAVVSTLQSTVTRLR